MQASLLGASVWFWFATFSESGTFRWRAIFSLLVTGKLFCLLGVLLVFAPRLLYEGLPADHGHLTAGAMVDQHLAGLLMLAVCPLTYLLAGVVIAAQWLRDLAADGADKPAWPPADRSHVISER
jgi:putative membrane protein